MYDHVLVPVDGSDCSTAAAGEAAVIAENCDARLSLLHVLDPTDAASDTARDRLAEPALRDAAAVTESAAVDADTHVRVGDPVDEIVDFAAETDTDFVAAGTHGRTGVRRILLGSVAERLVRVSPAPVLTVRGRNQPPEDAYREILFPVDGTEAGRAAAERELDFAAAFDAHVHALYVVDRRLLSDRQGSARERAIERLQTRGEEATAAIADRAAERGIDATTAVVEGLPRSKISTYAEEQEVDLIAMGTHGRTGSDRWLSESVAEALLRTASVPVLTARYGSETDERDRQ